MKILSTIGLQAGDIVNVIISDYWVLGINVTIDSIELTYDDFIKKRQINEYLHGCEYFISYKNAKDKLLLQNKYANYKLKAKVISKDNTNNNLDLELINIL